MRLSLLRQPFFVYGYLNTQEVGNLAQGRGGRTTGNQLRVLLTTEGTYPFYQGGVSTWCDILLRRLSHSIEYVVYSVITDPYVTQKFTLPDNASLVKIPLWGTEEPSEHLKIPFSRVLLAKERSTDSIVEGEFLPLLTELVQNIIARDVHPLDFGNAMARIHTYFERYEYKATFKSMVVWETFTNIIMGATADGVIPEPDLFGLGQSLGWIYRFFTLLNTPIPEVHVTHSSAAAFCAIPCIVAKIKRNTPFLLTEHGVYLREQYLSLSKRDHSPYLSTFLIRLVRAVSTASYAYADQVSPVCEYNTRWEKEFGVDESRIEVIYNGVDTAVFVESMTKNTRPTVVAVARIDPLKDILTLIRAAHLVRQQISDVLFVVHGSVSVPEYYDECQKLVQELHLDESFLFKGHTTNMAAAYQGGDIVALSSISEAFPYSVVEAMMSAKPVIATDVGGVREALMDTGVLVNPRDPARLAAGIVQLIQNPALRESLGQDARERALSLFTLERVLERHVKSYLQLSLRQRTDTDMMANESEEFKNEHIPLQLLALRAYALAKFGHHHEAIQFFRRAVLSDPDSPAVPVFLLGIAESYRALGRLQLAENELEKFHLLTTPHVSRTMVERRLR